MRTLAALGGLALAGPPATAGTPAPPPVPVLPVRRALRHARGAGAAALRASLRRTIGVLGWVASA